MWKWYEIEILEPINKVLLDHNHAYLSVCHLLMLMYRVEWLWPKNRVAGKARMFSIWSF